jgi:putative membrane protein
MEQKWNVAGFSVIGATVWADAGAADSFGGPGEFAGHMMGYGFGIAGIGMMVLVWATLIALAFFVFKVMSQNGRQKTRDSALDIRKERLARGEIDPEDYAARAKILGQ